jgi:protease IV
LLFVLIFDYRAFLPLLKGCIMKKGTRLFLIISGLMASTFFLLMAVLVASLSFSSASYSPNFSSGKRIGVMEIYGELGDESQINTDMVNKVLESFGKDKDIKGLVLHISSPGGGVVAAERLYYKILEFKSKHGKPVVAFMDEVSASGGYYVACAADHIVSTSGCITGSIGVIFAPQSWEGLYNKLGIHTNRVQAGALKTAGSNYPMSPEEEAMLQETVDDVYEQFLEVVLQGREDSITTLYGGDTEFDCMAKVRELAEGRIYTGRQAVELGLADELGSIESALEMACLLTSVPSDNKPDRRTTQPRRSRSIPFDFSGGLSEVLPKKRPLLQYRLPWR